jgi:hypothetical protein
MTMKKSLALVVVIGLCLGVLAWCRMAGTETEGSATKPEEPLFVPGKVLVKAKVVDWKELRKFLPKAPAGWKAAAPKGKIQRIGPHAASQVRQTFQRGGQQIDVFLEDLGSNNPYVFRKEAWKPLERETEGWASKKVMLGKVAAEVTAWKTQKRSLVFLVFEKRIQLNVSGTGTSDTDTLVKMAKQIDFNKLKKALKEKSK